MRIRGSLKCKEINLKGLNPFRDPNIQSMACRLAQSPDARKKRKDTFQSNKHQQGEKNNQYGTCWITKDDQNKKIKKENIDIWLLEGWNKGRKL